MTKSMAVTSDPSVPVPRYNFCTGHPNEYLVPLKEIQELLQEVAKKENESLLRDALNYGAKAGDGAFLSALAQFISRRSQDDYIESVAENGNGEDDSGDTENYNSLNEASPSNLFVTMGVSHAVDMLVATLTKPGDLALVERPTYFLIKGILESHNLKVKGLPMNEHYSIDFDALERGMVSGAIAVPRLVCIIPTNHNPTGNTMTYEDRRRLQCLSSRFGFIVIADEMYHFLDWRDESMDPPRPARMATFNYTGSQAAYQEAMPTADSDLDGTNKIGGVCISVSAFTKIFAPGVRLGWIEAPLNVINALSSHGMIRSQGGCSPLMGEVMRLGLERGIVDKVLENLKSSYQRRAEKLYRVLTRSPHIHIRQAPLGGYFLWLEFTSPAILSSKKVLDYFTPRLTFMAGSLCDPLGKYDMIDEQEHETITYTAGEPSAGSNLGDMQFTRFARICFAGIDETLLEEGADWFVRRLDEYVSLHEVGKLENSDLS